MMRHSVNVTVFDSLAPTRVTVSGKRVIEMLERLIAVGPRGTTAADFNPGTQVSDSIFKLRNAGIDINMTPERNSDRDGHHGRYSLVHNVEIDGGANRSAA